MSLITNAALGLRRLTSMVFRRTAYRIFSFAGSHVDYLSKVGDGTGSSTVTAPLLWVARTFPEAPPSLWQELDNGQEEKVLRHPLLRLLMRPNQFYTGVILWMATTMDWMVDGNAYWLKMRAGTGLPGELWWVPHWMMEPKGDEDTFITHYEYRVNGETMVVDPADVVHFRFGLDSDNPRLGSSPLKSVLREVYTDDEAAAFTAALLRNMGVPGLVVSPKTGVTIDPAVAETTKTDIAKKFTGDRRGEAVVMTGATDIAQFGFSPEQLLLKELRRIPEERVTAVLGIPAIVAGLGAGLDRSTFTNMGEAREAAYEAGIIPMQRILAEDIRFQLLTEFEADVFGWRFGFDLTKVRVLQEDLYRQVQRIDLGIRGGWVQVAEGRRTMGLEVSAEDEVYIRQLNTQTVPVTEAGRPVVLPGEAETAARMEVERLVDSRFQDLAREMVDMKAMLREQTPAEPPHVEVNINEGAVKVEASPPANVDFTVVESADVTLKREPAVIQPKEKSPRRVVLRHDDGTTTTYDLKDDRDGERTVVVKRDAPALQAVRNGNKTGAKT